MSHIPPVPPSYSEQQEQQKKSNNKVLWIILGIVLGGSCFVCVILAAILLPVFTQAKKAAQVTQSISQIKQLATSMVIYAADYDDVLPIAEEWQDSILPYTKDEALFTPPYESEPGGYAFNIALDSFSLTAIANPQFTPMLFETGESGRNLWGDISDLRRVGDYVCIAMSDSSAKRVPLEAADEYEWQVGSTE